MTKMVKRVSRWESGTRVRVPTDAKLHWFPSRPLAFLFQLHWPSPNSPLRGAASTSSSSISPQYNRESIPPSWPVRILNGIVPIGAWGRISRGYTIGLEIKLITVRCERPSRLHCRRGKRLRNVNIYVKHVPNCLNGSPLPTTNK